MPGIDEQGYYTPPPVRPKPPKKKPRPPVVTPAQPPNRTPSPGSTPSAVPYGPHPIAPYSRTNPVRTSMAKLVGYERPTVQRKPPVSYLQSHPLIAQQIRDAQQNMDAFDLGRLLHTILEEKYDNETEGLRTRLERKQEKVSNYYTEAQNAEDSGDLDYTEDNPINPRLLNFPDAQGQQSPAVMRQKMLDALQSASGPVERDAIRRLFNGNQYESGLIELAGERQDAIQYHADKIDDTLDYHGTSLADAAADIDRENQRRAEANAKYEGKPEWQQPLIANLEPTVNYFSTDPKQNPLLPGRSNWESKVLLDRMVQQHDRVMKRYEKHPELRQPHPTEKVGSVEVLKDDDNPLNVLGGNNGPGGEGDPSFYSKPNPFVDPSKESKFEKYIQHPVGASLIWTLDKASRPLYAVNSTLDYVYSQDEDPESATRNTLLGRLTGKDIGSAAEDFTWGDIGGTFKAGWKGFSSGGLGNSDDPVFFAEVIKHNAEADPDANIYDHGWYQAIAGFGGDVAFDPLSYATFGTAGIVKTGAKGARDVNAAKQFYADEDKVDQLLTKFFDDAGLGDTIDAKQARDLITGKSVRTFGFPQTSSQKTQYVKNVDKAVRDIDSQARTAWANKQATQAEQRAVLETKVQEYRARKEQVLNDHGMQEVRGILEEHIANQVQQGILPASALDRYSTDALLNTKQLAERMDEVDEFVTYHQSLAKRIFEQYDPLQERPRLTRTEYRNRNLEYWGSRDQKYIEGLIKDRDTIERRLSEGRAGRDLSEGERKQLHALDERIHEAQQKVRTKYQAVEKGNLRDLMRHEADLEATGDVEKLTDYAQKRAAAKSTLDSEGKVLGEYSGKDLRSILGEDLFNDSRFSHDDIYKAIGQARAFAYNDPELSKISGSIRPLRSTVNSQAKLLEKAQAEGAPKHKLDAIRKSRDDAQRALNGAQRTVNEAQATKFLHHLGEVVKTSGEANMFKTVRGEALGGLKNELKRRLNLIGENENRYTGVEHQRPDVRVNETTGEFEKPTEFLDPGSNRWDPAIFEPHPAYFSDKQHFEDMLQKVEAQLTESRRSYWDEVTETVDLNKTPHVFMGKDGKLNRDVLNRYLDLNPNTGVWTRKGDLQFPEWNEWVDEVSDVLTREYHDIRKNLAKGKDQALVNKVEDQAKEDWDQLVSQNVKRIAPMFRTKNGSLNENNLDRVLDGEQLFPYVHDPAHLKDELLLGKVSTNKRLEDLATPNDIRNANNARNVVDELVEGAGLKKTVQLKTQEKTLRKKISNKLNDNQLQLRVDYLIKQLGEDGWHFHPTDLEANVAHIVNNRKSAKDALATHNVVARRLFKDEHDMTLGEAMDLKQRTMLETVSSLSPGWIERYGSLTRREFIDEALRDFDSFKEVMRGGPFRFRLIGHSEKEARTVKTTRGATLHSPESAAGISRSDAWARKTWDALQTKSFTQRVRLLEDLFRSSRTKSREGLAAKKAEFVEGRKAAAKESGALDVSKVEKYATTKEAFDRTLDLLDRKIATKSLTNRGYSTELQLQRPLNVGSPDKELLEYAKQTMKKDLRKEVASKKLAAERATNVERISIESSIKELEDQIKNIDADFLKYQDRVFKAKALYEKELRTEAILRAARIPLSRNNRRARISILGADFAIPGTEAFFKSVDAASGAPLIKQTRLTWRKAFGAPSKDLGIDLITHRARALGMTPDIIKRDVQILTKDFGHIRPEDRVKAFKLARKGQKVDALEGEVGVAIKKGFDDAVVYFQNKYMAETGTPLTPEDINRFLKAPFRLNLRRVNRRMESADDLIEALIYTYDKNGQMVRKSYKELNDPLEVLWNLRVAINLASMRKAMEHGINMDFGVKRGYQIVHGKEKRVSNWNDTHEVVEDLAKQGWETIEELGGTHYFPPEAVKDIRNLLDMTSPHKANIVSDLIDAANGVWKASVTIYNPGYWTRNTVGEIMSSWLAGVNTVTPYRRAMKMMKLANTKEAGELEALHSQFPLMQHAIDGDKLPKGSDVVFTMANGEKITYERMLVAYNDMGLKTGFFNTEYRKQTALTSNLPGISHAGATHRKLRYWGENHEDWLRASHFMDSVAKSRKPFNEAILDAASEVRKYHFDYTDFSNFEKTVMLRAFPFYKWTRKAMPLMASQLFIRPGKMMVYPKAMNALSNQLSSQDFEEDTNGFMPNFTGIAPNWITNLMAYQVGTQNESGPTNAFRLSTPQMDALQSLTNLSGTAYTLANPYAKTGIEQVLGHTVGDEVAGTGFDIDLTSEDNPYSSETMERSKHALRNLAGPWGNFTAKSMGKNRGGFDNDLSRNDVLSQLTGLGFYDMFFKPGGDEDAVNNQDSVTSPAVGDERLEKLLRGPRRANRR